MQERPQGDLVDAVTSAGMESSVVTLAPRKRASDLLLSSTEAALKFLTLRQEPPSSTKESRAAFLWKWRGAVCK